MTVKELPIGQMAVTLLKLAAILAILPITRLHLHSTSKSPELNLVEIMRDFNQEYRIALNLVIDLNSSNRSMGGYNGFREFLAEIKIPRLVINQLPEQEAISALYENFNSKILTVVRLDKMNLILNLNLLDQLLWMRHFTNIIVQFEGGDDDADGTTELLQLFEESSLRGFTSLIVLFCNQIFTYNPFRPSDIKRLSHYTDFKEKSRLENFQLYEFRVADQDYPPRGFYYRNRQGEMTRSGYFYKIFENFIRHHNGSMKHEFWDPWAKEDWIGLDGFDFIPNQLLRSDDLLASEPFYYTNYVMMVPSAREIDRSLWLVAPFSGKMWLSIVLSIVLMAILFYILTADNDHQHYAQRRPHHPRGRGDFIGFLLKSLGVVLFIAIQPLERRLHKFLFNFAMCLLFLFTGFFLTNLYICNLSSIYTTRIFEPEILKIHEISRNNLKILLHSMELDFFLGLQNLPAVFYKRCVARANNTELHLERMQLNMSSLYIAREDVVDMLLFQQIDMKRPRAQMVPEKILPSHLWIPLPLRSKIIEQLNRFLSHVRDTGLLQKFMSDSRWDSYFSGTLQFFHDEELNRSLSMLYFQYAFIIWFLGLMCATLTFLCENLSRRRDILKAVQTNIFMK